ncbi:MAG: hypothetical protein ABSF99_05255, partial [Anaerolineales bacterium]
MPISRSKATSRKKAKPASGRSAPSRSSQPAHASSKRSISRQSRQPSPSLLGSISPEHKMDILGVVMALVGLLTMLSLFSANKAGLTGDWISALKSVFGWGVYILPVGLIVLGA